MSIPHPPTLLDSPKSKETVVRYQWERFLAQWNNSPDIQSRATGIERLIKLVLIIIQYAFPGLWFRAVFNFFGSRWRPLGIEIYVLLKVGIAVAILRYQLFFLGDWWGSFFRFWVPYMIVESVLYTASLIFCGDVFPKPKSYKRNLILLFFDYVEITIDFGSLYLIKGALFFTGISPVPVTSSLDAAYFSFVTSVTVGYGDIVVMNVGGKILTVIQILVFLLYGVLFLNFYANRIETASS
jgi:hypothetical protein